jgi:hypothetical protein
MAACVATEGCEQILLPVHELRWAATLLLHQGQPHVWLVQVMQSVLLLFAVMRASDRPPSHA